MIVPETLASLGLHLAHRGSFYADFGPLPSRMQGRIEGQLHSICHLQGVEGIVSKIGRGYGQLVIAGLEVRESVNALGVDRRFSFFSGGAGQNRFCIGDDGLGGIGDRAAYRPFPARGSSLILSSSNRLARWCGSRGGRNIEHGVKLQLITGLHGEGIPNLIRKPWCSYR